MTTWGVAMVKDEADIIGFVLAHMEAQVDGLLIADNGSTDGTREILAEAATDGLIVLDDPEVAYYQARKMTNLCRLAAEVGATWIVPFDADEVWYSPHGRIADVLDELHIYATAPALLFDHRAVVTEDQADDPNPLTRMGWRTRSPGGLPKVAVRACIPVQMEMGNHGAHYLDGQIGEQLVVRHFPYRSREQFVSKARNGAAAYAATTGLAEDTGAHWRGYGQILDSGGPEALHEVFDVWFSYADAEVATTAGMLFDPAPV